MTSQYSKRVARGTPTRTTRSSRKDVSPEQFEAILACLVAALEDGQGFYVRQYRGSGDVKVKLYGDDNAIDGYISYWGDARQDAIDTLFEAEVTLDYDNALHRLVALQAERLAELAITPRPSQASGNGKKPPQRPAQKATAPSTGDGEAGV